MQFVARHKARISGTQLEAALFLLDREDPAGARIIKQATVGTFAEDHWVSADTATKTSRDDAWHGALIKVGLPWNQSYMPPVLPL